MLSHSWKLIFISLYSRALCQLNYFTAPGWVRASVILKWKHQTFFTFPARLLSKDPSTVTEKKHARKHPPLDVAYSHSVCPLYLIPFADLECCSQQHFHQFFCSTIYPEKHSASQNNIDPCLFLFSSCGHVWSHCWICGITCL